MRHLYIKAINMELTDDIENYFREKMDSLDKYLDPNDESIECDARVSKTTNHHRKGDELYKAEVSLHTAGKNFGAESEQYNLYAAIDEVKDSVARKITSYKDKRQSLVKKGGKKLKDLLRGFKRS